MPDLFDNLPSMQQSPVTIAEQVQCVAREIKLRERVYPRLIQRGKLSQPFAERELQKMRAVLATLQSIRSNLRH